MLGKLFARPGVHRFNHIWNSSRPVAGQPLASEIVNKNVAARGGLQPGARSNPCPGRESLESEGISGLPFRLDRARTAQDPTARGQGRGATAVPDGDGAPPQGFALSFNSRAKPRSRCNDGAAGWKLRPY